MFSEDQQISLGLLGLGLVFAVVGGFKLWYALKHGYIQTGSISPNKANRDTEPISFWFIFALWTVFTIFFGFGGTIVGAIALFTGFAD